MPGLPTLSLKLDDGTGTFPYDITQYLSLPPGITTNRGRGDELSVVQPGSITLTLENIDGRFTLGSTVGYPMGIKVGLKIAWGYTIGSTFYPRITASSIAWPNSWPGGGDNYAVVTLSAADQMAAWSRVPLTTALRDLMLADGAWVFYEFTTPEPATAALINSGLQVIEKSTGPNTAPLYGATEALPAGTYISQQISWQGDALPLGNGSAAILRQLPATQAYQTGSEFAPFPMAASFSLEFVFRATNVSADAFPIAPVILSSTDPTHTWSVYAQISTSNALFGMGVSGGTLGTNEAQVALGGNMLDGAWHLISMVVSNGGLTLTVYIDGLPAGSATMTTAPGAPTASQIEIVPSANSDISIADVALYQSALTATQVKMHATMALGTLPPISADTLAQFFANYAGSTINVASPAAELVPAFDTNGSDVNTAIQRCVVADQGVLMIDGTGTPQWQGRHYRLNKAAGSPDAIVTLDALDPGTVVTADAQRLVNLAQATRPGGVMQQAQNGDSIDAYGVYSQSLSPDTHDDAAAMSIAAWLVFIDGQPNPRLAGVVFDMLTLDEATQQALASLDVSGWLEITGMPLQSPTGPTADVFVEGIAESMTDSTWTLTFNCSPNLLIPSVTALWIVGTSELGVNTRLAL